MLMQHADQTGAAPSEAELVRLAAARDESAIRSIMKANNQRLYRLARSILRHDTEAEDVVQETYIRLFTHLGEFRGESSLSTWLSRIAINEALGRVRKRRSVALTEQAETASASIIPFPLTAAADDPERTMAQREIQKVVERSIDELPDTFRTVLVARVMEGMTVEATAELLDLNVVTVKTRLHRARKLLRDSVERQIGPVAMNAFLFAGQRCDRLTEEVMRRLGFEPKA
jgi:RNA polymerase sigma-70 factor (ECF subfamily)